MPAYKNKFAKYTLRNLCAFYNLSFRQTKKKVTAKIYSVT
jgi:hypothetical protein